MTFGVLVVPSGGTREIAFRESGAPDVQDPSFWEDLAVRLVDLAPELPSGVEVHLIPDRSSTWLWDNDALSSTVRLAQNHCWGAPIYLSLHGSVPIHQGNRSGVAEMIASARQAGVFDLLQAGGRLPKNKEALRQAVLRSQARKRVLSQLSWHPTWRCLVPPHMRDWEDPFGDFTYCPDREPLGDWGLLIPVFKRVNEAQRDYHSWCAPPVWRKEPRTRLFVAVDGATARAPSPLPVMDAHGVLEARFAFECLLHAQASAVSVAPAQDACSPQSVRTRPNPTFGASAPRSDVSHIVITSGFRTSDRRNILHAAKEVGALVRGLSAGRSFQIHPAASCLDLSSAVSRMEHLCTWVHLSHGTQEDGLQQANGEFAQAERWLHAFRTRPHSLLLAVFSTCESDEIAKRFVEEGAAMAVGFKGQVESRLCRELTARVVDAAVRFGKVPEILQAFQGGVHALCAGASVAEPVAFYAR